jgi:hypothetical protein
VQLRALLAIAMIAVVGVSVAVVILATNDERSTSASSAAPLSTAPRAVTSPPAGTRYDGGPEEGTRGVLSSDASSSTASSTRYDGGPEEGSRGLGR